MKSEELSTRYSISAAGILAAMDKSGYTPPILHVAPSNLNAGLYSIKCLDLTVGIAVDTDLADDEWYIEWGGKRIGSRGWAE